MRKTKMQANSDAAIPSNSGAWKIMNYTRYRTSDLIAAVNIVEAEVLRQMPKGSKLVREAMSSYRPVSHPDVLFFDTFSGDNKNYDGSLRYVKSESWSEKNMIRIVPPEMLGISNIEMLAAARKNIEGHPIPRSATLGIIKAIAGKYDGKDPNYVFVQGSNNQKSNFFTEDSLTLAISRRPVVEIRFLDRPENKKAVISSGDARLRGLAQDKASEAISSIEYGKRQLVRAESEILQMNKYLTKCVGENPVDTSSILTTLSQIEAMLKILNNKLNTITSS